MTYTEDQLTGWFDVEKQKPWEKGAYEVLGIDQTDPDDTYSWWNGEFWLSMSCSPEYAARRTNKTCVEVTKWRCLSQNPNAQPKRSGNKRKVMYVVMFDEKPVAAFNTAKECKDYVKRGNIWWTSIEKIRFRTPEHN